jgi:hypothetical protein
MLAEIETALIARIRAVINGSIEVAVNGFPGSDDDQARALRQARVFVGYKRSTFELIAAEPQTHQQLVEFEVLTMVRDIRTYTGNYPILDAIRRALTGFWVDCEWTSGKCYPVAEAFVKVEEGIWYYSQTFAVPITIVEDLNSLYPPPYNAIEIRSGIYRAFVDDLDDAVLDRQLHLNP